VFFRWVAGLKSTLMVAHISQRHFRRPKQHQVPIRDLLARFRPESHVDSSDLCRGEWGDLVEIYLFD